MNGAAQVILMVAISVSVGFMLAIGTLALSLYLRRRREGRCVDPLARTFIDLDHRAIDTRPIGPIACRPLIRGDHTCCAICGMGPCVEDRA